MNWNLVRGLTYVAAFVASALAFFELADFNAATGDFDLRPFNLYGVVAAIAGAISSLLAGLALLKGWGRKDGLGR